MSTLTTPQLTQAIRDWGRMNHCEGDLLQIICTLGVTIKNMPSMSQDFLAMVVDDLGEAAMKIDEHLMPSALLADLPTLGGYYSTIGESDQPRSKS